MTKVALDLRDIGPAEAPPTGSEAIPAPVRLAAKNAVKIFFPGPGSLLAEGHRGTWLDGIRGVSVNMMSPGKQGISASPRDEMLPAYHAHFN